MRKTAEKFWQLVKGQCELLSSDVVFDSDSKKNYALVCDQEYKHYKSQYMKADTEHLDRHKLSAIMVANGLSLELIKPTPLSVSRCDQSDMLFIGAEKILLTCAISYLVQQVNHIILTSRHALSGIKKMDYFPLPFALSCDTSWLDIMSRTLYYNRQDKKISLLTLSEEFFLLEELAIRDYYGDQHKDVLKLLSENARL